MLKNLLESKKCFKLVCGAGNQDLMEVEKLTALYAKAGCRFFDLNASEEVIEAARRGLKFAGAEDAYLCVSAGIKGDPHVNKAVIDYEKCISCGQCDEICPQNAIKYHKVKKLRCIGCGRCAKICPKDAISYVSEAKELSGLLPPLINKGVDCIELHADGRDIDEIFNNLDYLKTNFGGMLSICLSRGKLSDTELVEILKKFASNIEPNRLIVQADGFPMSGGRDDFKTTLQAVATAEIVQNANLPVYILLSGGTNSKTAALAKMCGIDFNGIAIGSFARKIVSKYVSADDFLSNEKFFTEALEIARNLINSVTAA